MTQTLELNRTNNVKILYFKDGSDKAIEGHLVIGKVEKKKKITLERKREIEVKRDLKGIKKFLVDYGLDCFGLIKRTKKITVNEIFPVEAVQKEEQVIGAFTNNEISVENFLNKLDFYEEKLYAYDINGKKVGEVGVFGKVVWDKNIEFNETILQKDGKVVAIEKNGKFLDLEGKALPNQNQFIKKNSGIYYLENTENKKQATIKAIKIGKNLNKKQESKVAGIKKPRGAKLTKVGIPVVPKGRTR